jgi:uncharacterized membrane protein YdbT with pleckstrin-like domain
MENIITSLLILISFITTIILPFIFAIKNSKDVKSAGYADDDTFFMRR